MACPVLQTTYYKYFYNTEQNPDGFYSSSINVVITSGTTTIPLYGDFIVTYFDGSAYSSVLDQISPTELGFTNVPGVENVLSIQLTAYANGGTCVYEFNTDSPFATNCITTDLGMGSNGVIIYTEECTYIITDYLLTIHGCTDPFANNYNPDATVDDGSCNFSGVTIGCTDPDSFNYNINATVDDGSCIPIVYGCTDESAINYNPEANTSDGTCEYATLLIAGCTNPFGQNYNPLATVNDGSCVFVSGCTNPVSDNYNAEAVIDDGSCECNIITYHILLDGQSGITIVSTDTCESILTFEYQIGINCDKTYEKVTDGSIDSVTDYLNALTASASFITISGETEQLFFQYDDTVDSSVFMYSSGDTCQFLKTLYAIENGLTCADELTNPFSPTWQKVSILLPATETIYGIDIKLKEFTGGGKLNLKNINLTKYCSEIVKVCEKTCEPEYVLKSVELNQLEVSVFDFIGDNIEKYLMTNKRFIPACLRNGLDRCKSSKEMSLLVKDLYYGSINGICDKSGGLTYADGLDIMNRLPKTWQNVLQSNLPPIFAVQQPIKNFFFDVNKTTLGKKQLVKGITENNPVKITCRTVAVNRCISSLPVTYKVETAIESILNLCKEPEYGFDKFSSSGSYIKITNGQITEQHLPSNITLTPCP